MTCWPPFSRKGTRHRGNPLRLQWRTFAADIMAVRLQQTVIDATMCAIIAQFIRDLLDFAGLSSNLAYITSVFIGYIGTDSIGSLIKRFAAKKAGVEDGRNQPICWRGRRGADTDVRKPEIMVMTSL